MQFQLHKLTIDLTSPDEAIRQHWARLLEGWLNEDTQAQAASAEITLNLALTQPPLTLPDQPPLFTDADLWANGRGVLTVYADGQEQVLLHFQDGGLVTVPLSAAKASAETPPIALHGTVLPTVVASDRFEDVVFTSLAPALRRHGYFLVHAFAAARGDDAVLVVGQTHSGKTTTGLSLLLAGWKLLSNDVVLLEQRADGIYALPTPGDIGIRPFTFTLLPELARFTGGQHQPGEPYNVSAQQFIQGDWADAVRISAVVMPHVDAEADTALEPVNRALCLARLMEESIDRWDNAMLMDHMLILQQACQQAETFQLKLGKGVSAVGSLLESALNKQQSGR